jgi:hypothetical protein
MHRDPGRDAPPLRGRSVGLPHSVLQSGPPRPSRCPRCGPRKTPELRAILGAGSPTHAWSRRRRSSPGRGRPGRDRGAIGERWRSGWAHARWLPDRLTSKAPVYWQLVVRCWKRSSQSSVLALSVSLPPKLRVTTAGRNRSEFVKPLRFLHTGSSLVERRRSDLGPVGSCRLYSLAEAMVRPSSAREWAWPEATCACHRGGSS